MVLFKKRGNDKERPEGMSPLAVYGRIIVNKYSRQRLEVVDWTDLAYDRDRDQGSRVRSHGPGSSKCHDETPGCVKCREFLD
jgi:hypothetical protein